MSTFLFGVCGCCQHALADDQQTVIAVVPFWNGWVPVEGFHNMEADAGFVMPSWGIKWLPSVLYLRRHRHWTSNAGDRADTVTEYDIWGNLTRLDAEPQNAAGIVWTLAGTTFENPYTRANAAANAASLLDQVTLLKPDRVYNVIEEGLGFPATPHLVHFCYTSELPIYGGSVMLNGRIFSKAYTTLYVTHNGIFTSAAGAAGPDIGIDGAPWANAARNGDAGGVDLNGYWHGSLWAQKCAFRTRRELKTEAIVLSPHLPPSNWASYRSLSPAWPPGEYIRLPADVGGFGLSSLSADPAPMLPPAP